MFEKVLQIVEEILRLFRFDFIVLYSANAGCKDRCRSVKEDGDTSNNDAESSRIMEKTERFRCRFVRDEILRILEDLLGAGGSFLVECITLANCLSNLDGDNRDLINHCIDLYKNFQSSLYSFTYLVRKFLFSMYF